MTITPSELLHAMRSNLTGIEVSMMNGGCFQLYLMLKSIWPDAEAWYEPIDGHVYTKIGGRFYDIKGLLINDRGLEKMRDMGIVYEQAFNWKPNYLHVIGTSTSV